MISSKKNDFFIIKSEFILQYWLGIKNKIMKIRNILTINELNIEKKNFMRESFEYFSIMCCKKQQYQHPYTFA